MFRGEPFAGTSEPRLHFISDEQNAVLAADILKQLEVVARGNDEAAFAENGLGDNSGDGFRSDRGLEAGFVRMRFAGERHGKQRAAMEGVFETDYGRTLGVGAGDLDGVFDGFGTGVEEDGFFRKISGGQRVQFFRHGNIALVGSDGEAEMQVPLELLADRGEHPGRAMADVEAADAASEIEVAIAVDIIDSCALRSCGENRRGVRWTAWNRGFAARHQSA